jgi:hypothetical protein
MVLKLTSVTIFSMAVMLHRQMEFLILDVAQTIPQIEANGYFKVSKRLLPQVNLLIKKKIKGLLLFLFRNSICVGAGDWNNPYLLFHSLSI